MSDNPDLNMKDKNVCSQLSTYSLKKIWDLGARGIREQTVIESS
jgi:hypothetical protein